jgi:hypothetical protein
MISQGMAQSTKKGQETQPFPDHGRKITKRQ